MTLAEAKETILIRSDTPMGRMVRAAGVLCSPDNASEVTLLELLACMKRGNATGHKTPIDECAAIALYERTGRKRGARPYEDFISDAEDWQRYLGERGFI